MKKVLLSLLLALPLTQAVAQYNTNRGGVRYELKYDQPMVRRTIPNDYSQATANKNAAASPRWYNHAEEVGASEGVNIYDSTLSSYNAMWQDSTVRFVATGGGVSPVGINWLSIAEYFHPQSTLYTANNTRNRGKQQVSSSDAYTIDSVRIRGYYDRVGSYTDSLIVVFVKDSIGKFAFFRYTGTTPPTIFDNHGVDSFAAVMWNANNYQAAPITQITYTVSGNALSRAYRFAIPLTATTFADSLSDGTHVIRLAPNISVPAGGRIAMSVTFKSGTAYTPGTKITDYNAFYFLSHETTDGGYVRYIPNDLNMSHVCHKDSTNADVNPPLYMYIPSIAWTAPMSAELHNISWKVSCVSCNKVGVDDINQYASVGTAFPNPANSTLNIPITMKSAANVTVSISNLLGQVLQTQRLGTLGANQTRTAVMNTSSLADGVYFYTVEAAGSRVTNRVVIGH